MLNEMRDVIGNHIITHLTGVDGIKRRYILGDISPNGLTVGYAAVGVDSQPALRRGNKGFGLGPPYRFLRGPCRGIYSMGRRRGLDREEGKGPTCS